ncbi:MAG: polymer-forming cytoskeletal protein [Caldisericia bacterium]|nr:polymer-forming cytoskeletal protein [Caldisericia bacterium]
MKRFFMWLVVLSLVISAPISVFASKTTTPEKKSSLAINQDHFYSGTMVDLENITVGRNMFVIAQTFINQSDILMDAFVCANSYKDSGLIAGNAFVFTGASNINSSINGDLFICSGEIKLSEQAHIMGNVYAIGSTLTIDGKVDGKVSFLGQNFVLNGQVKSADISAETVKIGSTAIVNETFEYNSDANYSKIAGAKIEKENILDSTKFTEPIPKKESTSEKISSLILKLLSSLILAFVLFYIFKKFSMDAVNNSLKNVWVSLGIGAVTLVALPIGLIILFLTPFGYKVAFTMLFGVGTFFFFTQALAGITLGVLIYQIFTKTIRIDWLTILIGVATLWLINYIPYVGTIVLVVAYIIATGSILQVLWTTNNPKI